MEFTERPIKWVEIVGPIDKRPDRFGRKAPEFFANVRYVLDDGSKIETTISRTTKKDVLPAVEHENGKARAGELEATFADGKFLGTRTSYWIGPPR